MTVMAKFYCESIQHVATHSPDPLAIIRLKAAFGTYAKGDDNGNKDWSKYTPSGSIEMTVTNQSAIDQFTPGECYLLTFEKA